MAVNHCSETVIPVESDSGMKYEVKLPDGDAGADVRTRVAFEDTIHAIAGEAASWAPPSDSQAWCSQEWYAGEAV